MSRILFRRDCPGICPSRNPKFSPPSAWESPRGRMRPRRRRQETAVCGKSRSGRARDTAIHRQRQDRQRRILPSRGSVGDRKPARRQAGRPLGRQNRPQRQAKAMAAAVAFKGRSIPVAWRRCPNQEWLMALAELIAETLGWVRDAMNDLDNDRKGDSDSRQGNRQLAQAARGGRGLRDVLPDEGSEEGSDDDVGRRSIAVRRVVGRAWDVLASQGEGVQEVGPDRALGGCVKKSRAAGRGRRAPRCSEWALTCSTSACSVGAAPSVRRCSQAV